MNAKKILFPTDFSPASEAAFAYATSLARDSDALLLILHVEEPVTPYGAGELYVPIPEMSTAEVRRMLETIVPTDASVRFEHRLITGRPAAEIVRVAQDEDVDLIVMGTHGRTGLSRLLMGSVAEEVVRRAGRPVLTLRSTHQDPVHA